MKARHSFRTLVKRLVRTSVNPVLAKCARRRDYEPADSVVVAGAARSGTTWLGEVFSALPGTALLFEPFHPGKMAAARAAGIDWATFIPAEASWPKGYEYVDSVLRGRVLTPWTVGFTGLRSTVRPDRWIVKCIHANMFLVWLARNFPIAPPVLLVRHPCAVIASQLRQGWCHNEAPSCPAFYEQYPHTKEIVDALRHPEEYSAAFWCMQYYAPLQQATDHSFVLSSYEQLVLGGQEEVKRLMGRIGLELGGEDRLPVDVPSQMAKAGPSVRSPKAALDRWKRDLSDVQISRILQVVKEYGLDFYTDALEPDYDRLYGQAPACSM